MNYQDLVNFPEVLTIVDLQRFLQVGRSTAYRLVQNKEIACIRIGHSIRIPKEYVTHFLKNNSYSVENNGRNCYNDSVTADNKGLPKESEVNNDRLSKT